MSAVMSSPFASMRESFMDFDALVKDKKVQAPSLASPSAAFTGHSQFQPGQPINSNRPDATRIAALSMHRAICGSFDLCPDSNPTLIAWQCELLPIYFAYGSSIPRLCHIENALPHFRLGTWLAPGEAPIPPEEEVWWNKALAMRQAPIPNDQQNDWAEEQILRCHMLSARQQAELKTLGLLPVNVTIFNRTQPERATTLRNIADIVRDAASKFPTLERTKHTSYGQIAA